MPAGVRLWLAVLVIANLIVPLLYIGRLEAQVVLIVTFASFALMVLITGVTGFTRLLGLGHILWIPLLYFLWTRLASIPADDFYGLWIRGVMVVNAISLVINTIDV
ncbi:MAG: hypothetical protein ACE5LB_04260, partial [Acidiferrobacterales bacterium]